MSALPIALFWLLASWAFFSRRPVLIYLFFGSMSFGSFAVLPPQVTAGLTFTPTPIVALLIIARSLANRRGINFTITSAVVPHRLALLFLFWLVALVTTIFMPRVFAGFVDVIPVRGTLNQVTPLYPTNQNISQLAYLSISILAVFAFARILQSAEMRWHALRAMCLGGVAVVITGLLDYSTQFVPLSWLLAPFRTATYALLTDVQVLGGKRVIGLMPEASSYGGLCLGFLSSLYFFRHVIDDPKLRDRYIPALLVLLLIFTWVSKSSSAYVGIAVLAMAAFMDWCLRAGVRGNRRHRQILVIEFWAVFAALLALVAIVFFKPSLLDPIVALIDRMVLQKTSSHSYEERNMWTAVSWQAALDTWGLGVGLGSTRPSNAVVAVVSSSGFVGALLYYGFMVQSLFFRKAHADDILGQRMLMAIRWSFLPSFVTGLLTGTSADFGAAGAFRYGLAAAIAFDAYRQIWTAERSSTPSWPLPDMLAKQVAFGAAWLVGARIVSRGLDAIALLVVARILTPADFGLVALATAVFYILSTISDLSLSNALIQMRDPPKGAYDTAFTLNVIRGVILFFVMAGVSVPYASIYGDGRLTPLLLVLGIAPLIMGFLSPRFANLARELRFQPMVVREILARFVAFAVSVCVAYEAESYWALVVGRLAAPVVMVATSYRLAPYRPSFSLSHWRELLSFSTWLTLSQVLNALNFQMDRFLIGGSLGKPVLGQYSLGSELAALPTHAPLQPMMQALYSGLAKIAHDPVKQRAAYLRSQSLILFVVLPLGFLASAFAEPIVMVTLGPDWPLVGKVVAILAPVFAVQLMSGPANALCMARGRTRAIFWRDFANLCLRVPLVLAGLAYAGLDGVIWARVISGLVMVYFNLSLCGKLIGATVADQVLNGWRSFASTAIAMGLAYLMVNEFLVARNTGELQLLLELSLSLVAAVALYIVAHFIFWFIRGRPPGVERLVLTALNSTLHGGTHGRLR